MYFSVYLVYFTYIHNKIMTWMGSSSNMTMWLRLKPRGEWNRGFRGHLGPFGGAYLSQFSPDFNNSNSFGKWAHHLQFDTNIFYFWWNKNLVVFGPQIWTPISQWKMKWRGFKQISASRSLKFLSEYAENNNFNSPETSGPPLKSSVGVQAPKEVVFAGELTH